ncbi:MAG: hypothetical protein E7113_06990 [Bacteroidales bacterium]|nr:hypothetical protein [Bacteroidales bacterium]
MSRQYNHIYSKIVEDDTDVIGHIAYGLYKKQKINHIAQKKDGDDSKHLSEEDWMHFNEITCTDENIQRYRLQATEILQNFVDDALKETIKQIESDTKKNQSEILSSIIEPIKPKGWWHGVWQSVVGAIIFMFLAAGVVFFASLSEKEYTITFGGSGSAKIKETAKTTSQADTTSCDFPTETR